MKNILMSEIPKIPKAVLAEIISSIGLADVVYKDSKICCTDGRILSDTDVSKLIGKYIDESSESVLEDTMTLDKTYVISVSEIKYDDGIDDLPNELTFVLYSEHVDPTDEFNSIHDMVDNMISDKTGFCFESCIVHIEKYTPYDGTKVLS